MVHRAGIELVGRSAEDACALLRVGFDALAGCDEDAVLPDGGDMPALGGFPEPFGGLGGVLGCVAGAVEVLDAELELRVWVFPSRHGLERIACGHWNQHGDALTALIHLAEGRSPSVPMPSSEIASEASSIPLSAAMRSHLTASVLSASVPTPFR